jgi:hypothetical protein
MWVSVAAALGPACTVWCPGQLSFCGSPSHLSKDEQFFLIIQLFSTWPWVWSYMPKPVHVITSVSRISKQWRQTERVSLHDSTNITGNRHARIGDWSKRQLPHNHRFISP